MATESGGREENEEREELLRLHSSGLECSETAAVAPANKERVGSDLNVLDAEANGNTEIATEVTHCNPVNIRCGDKLGEARALIVLGVTHESLGDMDQAISTVRRAHDIARDIGWEDGLSTSLCRLGRVKLELGIHAEAEELPREAVRVARSSDSGWRLAQALWFSGECFRAQGRFEEAVSVLEESCTVYQNLTRSFTVDLANAAASLADSKSTLGHKEEALAWYDRAIAEYHKDEDTYMRRISYCLAAKDALLTDMKRRDEEALHGEASS
ncbi:hypothetical protein M407DRAFT_32186 [Tulasnella calospora MUT 4182]|uniref:Tetratricopeptide repeat protein 29 n=1 Tax=Tulasnella calospora MUT 4182 TaxID=1051891 RepID=A0A0C3Q4F3_9AGAM|nr:hypothetical protein M407DRAFT_32186 [Tulasnella calospora MUT 4182]